MEVSGGVFRDFESFWSGDILLKYYECFLTVMECLSDGDELCNLMIEFDLGV